MSSTSSAAGFAPRSASQSGSEMSWVQRLCLLSGVALVCATWLFLVFARPDQWDSLTGSGAAVITLVGYVGGAILILIGAIPSLPVRTVAVIPVALVLNIVVGEIVGSVGIPLYLDTLGTVLIAALAGPVAGMSAGVLTSVVWGFINPAALPFAAGNALIGYMSGWTIRKGAFRNLAWAIVAGILLGMLAGVVAAPVAAFVYGGTAGVGTGAVVSLFRELGNSLLAAVTFQSFLSDPLDKAIVMVLVWATVRAMPRSTVAKLGAHS